MTSSTNGSAEGVRGGRRVLIAVVGALLVAGATAVRAADRPAAASAPAAAPAAPAAAPSTLRLRGQKLGLPQFQRTEAGLAWTLQPWVTLELNYERSPLGPTMRHDHDDGILTRLKLGF